MKRVTGIGGIFVKAKDHEKLHKWYEKHLGIPGNRIELWEPPKGSK